MVSDFDISKCITPTDIAAAITAGVVAYIRNSAASNDDQQPQTGDAAAPQAEPAPAAPTAPVNPFADEVPELPDLTSQEERALQWCRHLYDDRGWQSCSIGNDLAFPNKWDVQRWAEKIGCEPERLQALIDNGAHEKMLGKLYCLGEVGNFSAGNLAAGAGFQATNANNMEFILDGQGNTDAIAKMFKTLLDGGSTDDAAKSFLTNLRGYAPTSLCGKAVSGALAKLGG